MAKPDLGGCTKTILERGRSYPCSNLAKVVRDGRGFCGMHDPEVVKARREARNQKWQEKWDAERKARQAEEKRKRDEAAELARLRKVEAVAGKLAESVLGYVGDSDGIAGCHRNGDLMGWDETDLPELAAELSDLLRKEATDGA